MGQSLPSGLTQVSSEDQERAELENKFFDDFRIKEIEPNNQSGQNIGSRIMIKIGLLTKEKLLEVLATKNPGSFSFEEMQLTVALDLFHQIPDETLGILIKDTLRQGGITENDLIKIFNLQDPDKLSQFIEYFSRRIPNS